MEELSARLKVALANTFSMYFKAHSYHWNVTGMFFPQLHDYFGELYQELHASIDPLAEQIRTLDSYAPRGLDRIMQLSEIALDSGVPNTRAMLANLEAANRTVLDSLLAAHSVADGAGKRGIVNFVEGRIDAHEKHGWMLRSIARENSQ